ncbi:hypothetical protein [Allorhizobium taibaishanense]|uniref:Uncharacterized protein n=1 Tax=Allorhizobium taibaishanense TaxID=887144 RepID=A0A7W6HS28_9HYPH|nr:hypothetical protein [Allorhizobium taibaishanense]MBB4009946.1 hypothetical protein [Allorhizobium taibaishanense]
MTRTRCQDTIPTLATAPATKRAFNLRGKGLIRPHALDESQSNEKIPDLILPNAFAPVAAFGLQSGRYVACWRYCSAATRSRGFLDRFDAAHHYSGDPAHPVFRVEIPRIE